MNDQRFQGVYPRPCGETLTRTRQAVARKAGLSPPMRGNRHLLPQRPITSRVYPRPCGETSISTAVVSGGGLSPPMRGNPLQSNNAVLARVGNPLQSNLMPQQRGSIPAHAGKPSLDRYRALSDAVYPRPCGETDRLHHDRMRAQGLSPPMRGNQFLRQFYAGGMGSIPAHAGKPRGDAEREMGNRVYPRPCGETLAIPSKSSYLGGLSPPMRGNPLQSNLMRRLLGSIPAHAGKPLVFNYLIILDS